MKRILYLIVLLSLTACNNKKPEPTQAYNPTPTGLQGIQKTAALTNATAGTSQPTNNTGLNPAHGAPGHRCDIAVGAPLNTTPSQIPTPKAQQMVTTSPTLTTQEVTTNAVPTDANGKKLNPAHGQPNHRCDIAVGAPLDSKPAQPSVNPTAPVQKVITPTNSIAANGKKLNPAHGQPNHRCDIAVGAPLNSKPLPVTTTNTASTQTAPQATTTASPQVPLLNEKGQRLNPAHGQPNHRCDIAVGAPLT